MLLTERLQTDVAAGMRSSFSLFVSMARITMLVFQGKHLLYINQVVFFVYAIVSLK